MLKKTAIIFLSTLLLQSIFCIGMVFAQVESSQQKTNGGVGVDQLLYKFNYTNPDKASQQTKLSYVKGLPEGDWQKILTGVIKTVLAITGSLALVSFTVAGVLFLTARGEEDKLTKAKQMLLWSVAALAIIAVSYAIVSGVSQLQFFQ